MRRYWRVGIVAFIRAGNSQTSSSDCPGTHSHLPKPRPGQHRKAGFFRHSARRSRRKTPIRSSKAVASVRPANGLNPSLKLTRKHAADVSKSRARHLSRTGCRAHPTADAQLTNVYKDLKGSDPENAKRIVLVTGHYDSRNGDTLDTKGDAPGANDDASGTAVSLECASRLEPTEVSGHHHFSHRGRSDKV